VANVAVRTSRNSKRITYRVTGDGSSPALSLAAAVLAGDALPGSPLALALAGPYATQAAARTALTEGPVKVFVRQMALPAVAAAAVVGAVGADPAATAIGVTAPAAVDLGTTQTLANALKADHNLLFADVAALRTAVNAVIADHNLAATDIKAVVPELPTYAVDVDLDAGAGTAAKINLTLPTKAGAIYYVDIVYNWSASGL
jgi:hypothetical protein